MRTGSASSYANKWRNLRDHQKISDDKAPKSQLMIPTQKKVAVTTGSREAQGLYELERTRELQFLLSHISETKMASHEA
jgi:hypothetical protein